MVIWQDTAATLKGDAITVEKVLSADLKGENGLLNHVTKALVERA